MPICVIPAAGSSGRMGRPKALLPWRETTVVETLTRTLLAGGVRHIWLVARPDDLELQAFGASASQISLAVNPHPELGMLASILAGVQAARQSEPSTGFPLLVCPVDHPLLEASTVASLLAAHAEEPDRIYVPMYKGRRGHPLLIPPGFLGAVQGLDTSRGLKQLMESFPGATAEIEVDDPGVVANLNTPEDYARAAD